MLLNFSVVFRLWYFWVEFRNWEIGRSQFFPFALVCAMKECAYLLLTAPVVHPEILNIFLSLDYHSTIKWQQRCMGEHFIFVLGFKWSRHHDFLSQKKLDVRVMSGQDLSYWNFLHNFSRILQYEQLWLARTKISSAAGKSYIESTVIYSCVINLLCALDGN